MDILFKILWSSLRLIPQADTQDSLLANLPNDLLIETLTRIRIGSLCGQQKILVACSRRSDSGSETKKNSDASEN